MELVLGDEEESCPAPHQLHDRSVLNDFLRVISVQKNAQSIERVCMEAILRPSRLVEVEQLDAKEALPFEDGEFANTLFAQCNVLSLPEHHQKPLPRRGQSNV